MTTPAPPQNPSPAPRRQPSKAQAAPGTDRSAFVHGLLVGAMLSAIVAGLMFFVLWRPQPAPITIHAPPTVAPTPAPSPQPVVVHITGEVAAPGVYSLPPASRVRDAIDAAGGLAPDADASLINLAQPLADGSRVYIPRVGEAAPPTEDPSSRSGGVITISPPIPIGPVDLNSASLEELVALSGIGEAKAEAIIAGRPYRSVDDLDRVTGFGPATIDRLRPYVTVR